MALRYLALGDSYTIGESLPLRESFPYQFVQVMRRQGMVVLAPEIIAKTGWTTDELDAHIQQTKLLDSYELVTLLIGVNNQYRGRSVTDFEPEFEKLLVKAISFCSAKNKGVVVLSIPDWGCTPFAKDRDAARIAGEIDAYNKVCESLAKQYNCTYIDITSGYRKNAADEAWLAADLLHPSGREYAKWAEALAKNITVLR